jgi:hypothetical protein
MTRIVIVILTHHRHKPIDSINPALQKKHCTYIIETDRLMLFTEAVAVITKIVQNT